MPSSKSTKTRGGLGQGRERASERAECLDSDPVAGGDRAFIPGGSQALGGGVSSSSSPGPPRARQESSNPTAGTPPPHSALERGQPEGSSSGQARVRTSSPPGFGTPMPNKPIAKPSTQAELMYNCMKAALDLYQHPGGNSSSSPQDPPGSCPGSQRIPLLMPQKSH